MGVFSSVTLFFRAVLFVMEMIKNGQRDGRTVAQTLRVLEGKFDARIDRARDARVAPDDPGVRDPYDRAGDDANGTTDS